MLIDVAKWKNNAKLDDGLKKELLGLNEKELHEAFYTDLAFGTGGMRGILGPGTNRMNIYTLRRANYGYGKYILQTKKPNPSVVIAYDNRHNSLLFAHESARVLATMGIKVLLFDKITPTPELSFAVRELKATGGIVITASHNPPNYNGYKIYDDSGCQLVPDLADIVIAEIAKAPEVFAIAAESFDNLREKGLIAILDDKIDIAYLSKVKDISVNKKQYKGNFLVVFTALHGTSSLLGQRLLKETGYNYIPVAEQMIADPNFTTVTSPNPENPEAYELAIKYAKKHHADICIATDPDADRLGVAVLHKGEYVLLNGNQTGAILVQYLAKYRKLTKKGVLFNTIVTSSLGAKIAEKYGIDVVSTLTGFKFIGEQARLLENTDREFFFGYEESYGYVVSDFVRDKDSLQALLLCSEVACFYKNLGKTLVDVLVDIYEEYGYYQDHLVNINLLGASGAEKIEMILDYFREDSQSDINGLKIVAKEDYLLQKRYANDKVTNLKLPPSNVIKYFLDDGSWFVLRPSGTEPKMKVYISVVTNNKKSSEKRILAIEEKVMELVNKVRGEE
ncbi:MAG TPA: phospho-sugar mutase [Bacilli bacterium]|nr:phospho-sugar mutase [Bacilli bacterium]